MKKNIILLILLSLLPVSVSFASTTIYEKTKDPSWNLFETGEPTLFTDSYSNLDNNNSSMLSPGFRSDLTRAGGKPNPGDNPGIDGAIPLSDGFPLLMFLAVCYGGYIGLKRKKILFH